MTHSLLTFLFVLALIVPWQVSAQGRDDPFNDTALILDASGSMWGQIDGTNKIVIAKDVLEAIVRGLPQQQRLGFVAYGHREKGNCQDIETIAPVGAKRQQLISQIRALSPKGKTPLSQSIRHAAHALNFSKQAATVVLVSDGLENCQGDPCEMAKNLQAQGLDFTVHVVGFDVDSIEREGLQCIAEHTGGRFVSADTANELFDALQEVGLNHQQPEAKSQQAPQTVAFKATILKGGPEIQHKLNWTIKLAESEDIVFSKNNTGYLDIDLVPGRYLAEVEWTGWPHQNGRYKGIKRGSLEFTLVPNRPMVITVPIELKIPVILKSEPQIDEGAPLTVTWSGPDELGTFISSNALDDDPREAIYFVNGQQSRDKYVKSAAKNAKSLDTNGDGEINQDDLAIIQVGGPSHSGDYEVRYVLRKPLVILARQPLKVTDSNYTLNAPAEIPAAANFEVQWTGRLGLGGAVHIEKADLATAYYQGPRAKLVAGKAVTIAAPADPGDYEIRYVMYNGYTTYPKMHHAIQARRPIKVTPVSASIQGPQLATGGDTISLDIQHPDEWQDDGISIIKPGALKTNQVSRSTLARMRQSDGKFAIRMPAIPGEYEIAYFHNPGSRIITRQSITIVQAKATVDAPDQVIQGQAFEVRYTGDGFAGDRIIICPENTPDHKMWGWGLNYGFAVKTGETSGTYDAIKSAKNLKPGKYEARYVTGLQHHIIARDSISVIGKE